MTIKELMDMINFTDNDFAETYKESLSKFMEINKDNFKTKFENNKSGASYAQSFLSLDSDGQNTPIQLLGTLKKDRYKWNNDFVKGTYHFTGNAEFNSFLLEKVYEELLLDKGPKAQEKLQKFFNEFVEGLQQSNVPFIQLNLVDYNVLVA